MIDKDRNNRRLRWFLGLIVIITLIALILIHPIGFLRRGLFVLLLCCAFCLWRICLGPTAADRIVSMDIFGILIVGFCAILGVATKRSWYIDIGIAWALQSFIGTLALAKYLEGRGLEE